ncbi:hypothetical protein BYT27DRAFT_7198414 [Phlegmacium glaucopus]|nr:hypothetical protein BYT27DRAFT_7198414 [Phlegmacium glaucopus]
MKKEIETLKETLHQSKKLTRRQAKQLEESKAGADAAVMAMKDREIELGDVKTKCRKNEELLSTIETSVQCQICMDLPDKPFALNPCGHVLCLSCLQEWFRKAPPALDDMDVDPDELTDPQYVLMRSKTCPACRAVVKHRPVPIFMVKSVVTVLKKAKSPHASSRHNNDHLHTEDNPWKGIFASSEEEDDDESQLESDSDGLDYWPQHSPLPRFEAAVEDNATTESEMENEDEEEDEDDGYGDGDLYTHQRWAPPSVSIADYDFGDDDSPDTLKLLQRGCSWDMLQNFDVSYSHDSGIVVALRSLNHLYASDDDEEDADNIHMHRVFLGWNISLHPSDIDGEDYMQQILREIKDIPERWLVTATPGVPFARDARRLVCVDEVQEFDNTDTEAWFSD